MENEIKNEAAVDKSTEVTINSEAPEVEIEIVDDTPKEDRGRKPLDENPEPSEEELEQYSEAVQKRISKMKHGLHDERRAKEAAQRERDEAVRITQQILREKQELERRAAEHEEMAASSKKTSVDAELLAAKQKYKEAYESGNPEAMADAQIRMAELAAEKKQAENWGTQAAVRKENALQAAKNQVEIMPSPEPVRAQPDEKAKSWVEKNDWFSKDEEMTALAYAVHDKLIREGIDPARDAEKYYSRIDQRMRQVFPDYEWDDKDNAPVKKKPASVVASVTRTTNKSTRVSLNQSQLSLARRLGLTPEQYAVQVAKLEGK